jgi:FKBP-type peptidyl-prolyl cis-trans isomerase SlyD
MKVANHSVVSIHYTLTNNDGEVLDSSEGQAPLTYLHGVGNLIPGLEKELLDKAVGDEFDVTVAPGEGYGEQTDELVQTVPSSVFEGVEQVEPGMQFRASGPGGEAQLITVTSVEGDMVTIDGNPRSPV